MGSMQFYGLFYVMVTVCASEALGSIHTRDLLGVNYCVNFSVQAIRKNEYKTHYLTFQSTQKVDKIPSVNVPA